MKQGTIYTFPIGEILILEEKGAITDISLRDQPPPGSYKNKATALTDRAAKQLTEYFAGQRRAFDLPLSLAGTPWQRRVWEALLRVPYGKTVNYGQLALEAGNPLASRAVGGAVHRNPLLIVVPCHRVIAADGTIGGFGSGLPVKRKLLKVENCPAADAREKK